MNASERVLYYTESIPHEAPWTAKELEDTYSTTDSDDSGAPPSNPSRLALAANGGKAASFSTTSWPEQGAITFRNLKMRYRPETPLVLKGLTASIAGGERIGIVGRTGK